MNPASEKRIRPTVIFTGIIIWVTILSTFTGFADTDTKNERQITPLLDAGTKSKVFYGELADHSGYSPKEIDQKAWKSNAFEFTLKEKLKAKELWYHIESLPLDVEDLEQPMIYIPAYLNGLYVYLNGRQIYRYGTLSMDGPKVPPKTRLNHFIAIDTNRFSPDDPMVIHIAVSLKNLVWIDDNIAHIGSAQAIRRYAAKTMRDEVRQDIPYIIWGGFLFFSGIASFALFFNHLPNREYPFLSFGFFLLCASGTQFFSPVTCTLLNIPPIVVSYFVLFKFLIPVGLIAFFNQIYASKILRDITVYVVLLLVVGRCCHNSGGLLSSY